MNVLVSHAQIFTEDSEGWCGANIHPGAIGCVADIYFWGGDSIWVARRKGNDKLHILIAPSDRWKVDIEGEDFEIIGKLSDLVNV